MRPRSWQNTDKNKNSSHRGGWYLLRSYSKPGRIRTRPRGHPRGCVSKMPATCIVVPDLKSSLGPQPGLGGDKIYPEKFSRTPESSAKKMQHRGRAGVRPGVRESFLEEAVPVLSCDAAERGRNQAGRGRGRACQVERRPGGWQCHGMLGGGEG